MPSRDPLNALRYAVKEALRATGKPMPPKCLLCPSIRVHDLGAWLPDDEESKAFFFATGKTRVIAYCVCERCFKLKNVMELVEQVIFISPDARTYEVVIPELQGARS